MVELVRWLGMETHLSPNDAALIEASREL